MKVDTMKCYYCGIKYGDEHGDDCVSPDADSIIDSNKRICSLDCHGIHMTHGDHCEAFLLVEAYSNSKLTPKLTKTNLEEQGTDTKECKKVSKLPSKSVECVMTTWTDELKLYLTSAGDRRRTIHFIKTHFINRKQLIGEILEKKHTMANIVGAKRVERDYIFLDDIDKLLKGRDTE